MVPPAATTVPDSPHAQKSAPPRPAAGSCGVSRDARLAASCVTGAFMEALVGPLAEADAPGPVARERARAIAAVAARMVFKQSAPKLTLVSKRLR